MRTLVCFIYLCLLSSCVKRQGDDIITHFKGRVFDTYTGKPIAGATVYLFRGPEPDVNMIKIASTNTDANGEFFMKVKINRGPFESQRVMLAAAKEGYEVTYDERSMDRTRDFQFWTFKSEKENNISLFLRKVHTGTFHITDVPPYLSFSSPYNNSFRLFLMNPYTKQFWSLFHVDGNRDVITERWFIPSSYHDTDMALIHGTYLIEFSQRNVIDPFLVDTIVIEGDNFHFNFEI